jgi:hypothetical protein
MNGSNCPILFSNGSRGDGSVMSDIKGDHGPVGCTVICRARSLPNPD